MSLQRANVLPPFIRHSSCSKCLCSVRIPNQAFPRSFQADGKSQAFVKGSEVMWKGNSGERSPAVERTFSSQRCGPDWPVSYSTESLLFVVRCHRAWVSLSGRLANAFCSPPLVRLRSGTACSLIIPQRSAHCPVHNFAFPLECDIRT